MRTFDARTLAQWRAWLEKHHASRRDVWLVFHKQHTGVACVSYKDALDEALCFGWIDSLVKRIDEDRYARKFTPRKPDSVWSSINIRRYTELKAANRLMPPGLARSPEGRPVVDGPKSDVVPHYIAKALRRDAKVWQSFLKLPPSHRRNYVGWIDSAKREETKQKRLIEAAAKLRNSERLGIK